MKTRLALLASFVTAVLAGCNGSGGGPAIPEPTIVATAAPEPTASATASATAAPTAGATAAPTSAPTAAPTAAPGTASVNLVPYSDPWDAAAPRWRDVANNEFTAAFRSGTGAYSYANASVTLTYERAPGVPYFVGRITGRGLKPNFAYQLKLAGKPVFGNRGFGSSGSYVLADSRGPSARPVLRTRTSGGAALPINGDDWANQQLGYAGRWWDDTEAPTTNLSDGYFVQNYPSRTLYGYIFMGVFVTDEFGRANALVNGGRSYHITWQDTQDGPKEAMAGLFTVRSANPPYLGYGRPLPTRTARLWYEFEAGRPRSVRLSPGTYHARLLITEEAFHGAGGDNAGVWQTVLASEGPRDSNPANDLVFTIR